MDIVFMQSSFPNNYKITTFSKYEIGDFARVHRSTERMAVCDEHFTCAS